MGQNHEPTLRKGKAQIGEKLLPVPLHIPPVHRGNRLRPCGRHPPWPVPLNTPMRSPFFPTRTLRHSLKAVKKPRRKAPHMHPALAALGLPYPIFQAPMAGVSTPALAAAVARLARWAPSVSAQARLRARKPCFLRGARWGPPTSRQRVLSPPRCAMRRQEQAWIQHFEGAFRSRGAVSPKALTPPYVPFPERRCDAWSAARSQAWGGQLSLRPASGGPAKGPPPRWHPDPCERYQRRRWPGGPRRPVRRPDRPRARRGDIAAPSFQKETKGSAPQRFSPSFAPLNGPFIAAGGVMTGHDLRALLNAGADAVQLGTAFLLCPEAGTGRPTAPA